MRSAGIAFGDVRGAIAFWDVGVRSLLGCGGDRFWDVGAIAFGMWECDRFLGCERAIAFRNVRRAIAFGMWGMRSLFWDVGGRSLFGGVEGAIAFWMWEGDRFLGM